MWRNLIVVIKLDIKWERKKRKAGGRDKKKNGK